MQNISEKEILIQSYLAQGNKEGAIKSLFDLVVVCAKEKDFETAEAMRTRISEIDALALGEIIRAGEIIEEEKNKAIDREHRRIWAKLYDSLSNEEANALYFALSKETYRPGETIFKQGELTRRLYFINSGRAKIVYIQDEKEVFLKTVAAGRFAGEDSFFYYAVCTTTMIAQSELEVSCLDSSFLTDWKTTFPALEDKLQGLISGVERTSDLIKAKGMNRRSRRRIKFGGKATALLTNSSGGPLGKPFRVELSDISQGGASFMVKISKKETASMLLGKRLLISYLPPEADPSSTIRQSGVIVGVHFPPFGETFFNVKFDVLLHDSLTAQLEELHRPSKGLDF